MLYDIARVEADRVIQDPRPGERLEAAAAIIRVVCALQHPRRLEAVDFTTRGREAHHPDHLEILGALSGHETLRQSAQIPQMMESMYRFARDTERTARSTISSPRELIEYSWSRAAIQEVRGRFIVHP
jgi:hypothetical protein